MLSSSKLEITECVVCTLPIEKTNMVTVLGCNHKFCIDCLKAWSLQNPVCPLDRQELVDILLWNESENKTEIQSVKTLIFQAILDSQSTIIKPKLQNALDLFVKSEKFLCEHQFVFDSLEDLHSILGQKSFRKSKLIKPHGLLEDFIINLPGISKIFNEQLNHHCAEVKHCTIGSGQDFNEMHSQIIKHFPNNEKLRLIIHDMQYVKNCFLSLCTVHWHYHDIRNYFYDLVSIQKQLPSDYILNSTFVRVFQDQITNLLTSHRIMNNYLKLIKAHFLKISLKENNVQDIFENSSHKCLICKTDNSKGELQIICDCNHKCCNTCVKMFDLTNIRCPFGCPNSQVLPEPDVNKIAVSIQSLYRNIVKKTISMILDNMNLIKTNFPHFKGKIAPSKCSYSFFTQYDKLLTFNESLKQEMRIHFYLQQAYESQFKHKIRLSIDQYMWTIKYLLENVIDPSINQMLDVCELEKKLITNKGIARDVVINQAAILESNIIQSFESWKPGFCTVKEIIQRLSKDKLLRRKIGSLCNFSYRTSSEITEQNSHEIFVSLPNQI